MEGTTRNGIMQPHNNYYVRLALDALGDDLTPGRADEIRQIARSALNDEAKLVPFKETRLEHSRVGLDNAVTVARADQARATLLLQGRHRFGKPAAEVQLALNSIRELDRLNRMAIRLLTASTWNELLATK